MAADKKFSIAPLATILNDLLTNNLLTNDFSSELPVFPSFGLNDPMTNDLLTLHIFAL